MTPALSCSERAGKARASLRAGRKRLDKFVRRCLRRGLGRLAGSPPVVPIEALGKAPHILLIRSNFRIGNAVISAPVIEAFRRKFPGARIDFLAADSTRALYRYQSVDEILSVSREWMTRPWRLIVFLRTLRSRHYDLAVQITPGSFSDYVLTRAVGARSTMGIASPQGRRYHIEADDDDGSRHAYDGPRRFARALGVECRDRPSLRIDADEDERARALLHRIGVGDAPFTAVFIGGHDAKRWPTGRWLELIGRLQAAGVRFVVFTGPEEQAIQESVSSAVAECDAGHWLPPQPLRDFAALIARARLLVTPDSGPMHLAAALDVPTVVIAVDRASRKFVPRGPDDLVLWHPEPAAVSDAVCSRVSAAACVHDESGAGAA